VRVGCHGSVWVPAFDRAGMEIAMERTRAAGFDLIEIPLMDPDDLDVTATRAGLERRGLTATASLGLKPELDLSSADPAVSARGEAHLGRALEVVHEVGGTHLCGVIACAMTKYQAPPTARGRAHSVEAMRRLGDRAAALGVVLCVEVVNRYESNLFNTARQGLDYLEEVGSGSVRLHLDAYHMNIEEADHATPIVEARDRLGYLHVGESHRGYLGTGTIDFDAFFAGLAASGFDGPLVFESFSSAVVHKDLSTMLAIWRDPWSDSEDLATRARAFIREGLVKANS
jgi:D-psicose/D-tagatose/L-ribulose 3-epimerase